MSKVDEMWQALEAHKPAPGYADAWATMLKERTLASVDAVWGWVPDLSAVDDALWHLWETLDVLREAEISADLAINAIRGGEAVSNITLPRAAIEQIREALFDIRSGWVYIRSTHGDLHGVGWERAQVKTDAALTALDAALAEPEQKPEPVAFTRKEWSPDCGEYVEFRTVEEMKFYDRTDWTPLYAAPPQPDAKPEPVVVEQLFALAKLTVRRAADPDPWVWDRLSDDGTWTPFNPLIHGPDMWRLEQALRAALAEPDAKRKPVAEQHPEKGPALTVYNEIAATDDPGSPLERLRFFCSLAMRPQDWLDVAPFFDALAEPEKVTPSTPVQYGWLCPACGRGNAPLAQTCSCKGWPSLQITCGPATMTGGT